MYQPRCAQSAVMCYSRLKRYVELNPYGKQLRRHYVLCLSTISPKRNRHKRDDFITSSLSSRHCGGCSLCSTRVSPFLRSGPLVLSRPPSAICLYPSRHWLGVSGMSLQSVRSSRVQRYGWSRGRVPEEEAKRA